MKHYVVISADCHAGPNSPVYKDFLDPKYHDDFEVELAQRQALIDERREAAGMSPFMGDAEFKEEWFGEDEEGNSLHEIGMRGAWDAAKRDEELDNDGVTGEVMFPGPDAATGTMGAPFGAGFNPVATMDPEHLLAGARAYNRWAAEICQESPERRAGLIVAPILGDLDGAIAEIQRAHADGPARRHHHPAAVGRPRVVHELPLRPRVGGGAGARPAGALPLGSRRAPGLRRSAGLDERLRLRDDLLHRADRCGSCCSPACSSASRGCAWRSPKRAASGRPTCCGDST